MRQTFPLRKYNSQNLANQIKPMSDHFHRWLKATKPTNQAQIATQAKPPFTRVTRFTWLLAVLSTKGSKRRMVSADRRRRGRMVEVISDEAVAKVVK